MKWARLLAASGLFTLGVAAMGPGCAKTKCAAGDAECFLDNLVFKDQNGNTLEVVIVPAVRNRSGEGGTPHVHCSNNELCDPPGVCMSGSTGVVCAKTCSSPADCPSGQTCLTSYSPAVCGTGGLPPQSVGGTPCGTGVCPADHPYCYQSLCYGYVDVGTTAPVGTAPSIDSAPAPVTFDDSSTEVTVTLDFTDPAGCQPAFCFTPCPKGMECATRSACTHSVGDGKNAGRVIMTLGTKTEPPDDDSTYDVGVTPVSKPGCGDPTDDLANGDDSNVLEGTPVHLEVTVKSPPSSSGGGTDTNKQCSGFESCKTCSIQACASASSDGSCSAWYEASDGQRFDCNGCSSCQGAAQSVVSHCCPTN